MSRLRRLGAVLLVVAVLAAGHAIGASLPDRNGQLRPFPVTGDFGTDVTAREFTARAVAVRCAAELKIGEAILSTQGVWVVVRLRLTARREVTSIQYAAIRDAEGRVYEVTDRFEQPLVAGGRRLQPGIRVEGEIALEVPATATGTLTLLLAATFVDHRMDSMTEIPLPIGDAGAALRDPAATEVLAPRLVTS
ncbi:hypothetical protein [Catellatospora sp. NPDC049609]|uniref:hypothetical protein n=1 Tax=Catellatospora sp. NPDC049609 TaxID=3155505 RepID=UPI00342C88D8